MHSEFIFKAVSKLHKLFYIRYRREGSAACVCVCVMHTQIEYWKSTRDELGGRGMGHYVITEWWSQRGIKMFQTNITSHALSWSNALLHRMCVFARAFEQMRKSDGGEGGQKVCVSVIGCVYCASVSSQSLWFQSVTVSRDCGSVSAAPLLLPSPLCLSSLSWVQLNTCSLQ